MRRLLLTASCLSLFACTSSPQWEEVMAKKDRPGQYVDGDCRLWAKDIQGSLTFPSTRISWTATGIDPFAKSARHEALCYKLGKEIWFVDNFSKAPRWVGMDGERIEVLVQQFYAPDWVVISNIAIDGK